MPSHSGDIRCICARKPLLAVYGVGKDGPYIHVKVFKQSRIYAELFIEGDAVCKLRCRECLRLQKIKIISGKPTLQEVTEPVDTPSGNIDPVRVAPIPARP